jgi:hypothetical protein
MVVIMQVSGKMINLMVVAPNITQTDPHTRDSTIEVKSKAKDGFNGLMASTIKGSSTTIQCKGKE